MEKINEQLQKLYHRLNFNYFISNYNIVNYFYLKEKIINIIISMMYLIQV